VTAMADEPIFHLSAYEGPLDLLLSLIIKNKYDIRDIPISPILDQYIEYVNAKDFTDDEYKADFVAMTSHLLLIKSRMLLPKRAGEDEEEDPRARLAAMIEEYALAKRAAEYLDYLKKCAGDRFTRNLPPQEALKIPPPDGAFDPAELEALFAALMRRIADNPPPAHDYLPTLTERREVSVDSRIIAILRFCRRTPVCGFADFTRGLGISSMQSLVVTFIALLELLRAGRVVVEGQDLAGARIEIIINN